MHYFLILILNALLQILKLNQELSLTLFIPMPPVSQDEAFDSSDLEKKARLKELINDLTLSII